MATFDIDCIVVGKNQGTTLRASLEAVRNCSYSQGRIHLHYIDMGSADYSLEIARSMEGVKIIALHGVNLGAAYNAAWKECSSPFIQFLSADALLDPSWFEHAFSEIARDVGGVTGRCQLTEPHGSIFNWIDTLEWRSTPPGGGIGRHFLLRRELLQAIDGFDEHLLYGTALDFAHTAAKTEWKLRTLQAPMCQYAIGRSGFTSWWRSGVADGRGETEVSYKEEGWRSVLRNEKLREAVQRGGGTYIIVLFALLGWLSGVFWSLILLAPAAILLLSPRIFRLDQIGQKYHLSPVDAAAYGWHLSCFALPRCWGVILFLFRRLFPRKA
jgi:Glycosyl transferase family 2